jgi:CHAT domain-containing protein
MGESGELKGFLLKVEEMIRKGDLRDAYRLLKTFITRLPAEPTTLESTPDYLEGCFWDNDEFFKFVEDNRATLEKSLFWVEMPPAKALYWLAYIAFEWGDLEQALCFINQGLALDPTRPQMLCEKGEILKGLRRFDEALACYRVVTAASGWVPDSQKARAYRGQGFALIEMRRLEEAESAFHESLNIEPDNENARHELRYIEDVRAFLRQYDLKDGSTADDLRKAAELAFAEAEQIINSEGEEEMRKTSADEPRAVSPDEPLGRALTKYAEALRFWREAGDFAGQAQATFGMGRLYAILSDIGKVIECYHEASNLWHEAGGHEAEEALALYKLGSLFFRLGRDDELLCREGLGYLKDALHLNRKAKVREGLAATLLELGELYETRGDYHKAIGYFEQLLDTLPPEDSRSREANALLHIARDYGLLGQLDFALSFYTRALELAQGAGDKKLEALTRNNASALHARMGHFDEALRHLWKAADAAQSADAQYLLAPTLNAIGATYYMSGVKHEALRFYERSLQLRRELKDRRGEAATLSNMGLLYFELANLEEARNCFRQALKISREDKDKTGEANTLHALGEVCYRGRLLEEARKSLEDALKVWERIKDLSSATRTLAYLAYTHRELGNLDLSLQTIEKALGIAETLRVKVYNPDWRASILASNSDFYEFYVDLLVDLGRQSDAFAASEKRRARSLLDMLAEAGVDIREGADTALAQRERELVQMISAKEQDRVEAEYASVPQTYLFQLDRSLNDLRAQLQLTRAELRASSPHYAALTQPRLQGLEEVQRLLEADTLLLEYALGRERSHLWVVSHDSMEYYRLPSRDEIEIAALRLYGLLSAPDLTGAAGADAELSEAVLALSLKVLAPVGAAISTVKRLLVVGDGALQYVPFAALIDPAGGEGMRSLVSDHEIIYLPSASTLAALRRDGQRQLPAPSSVAIFADPVFDRSDERVVHLAAVEAILEGHDSAGRGKVSDFSPLQEAALWKSAEEVGLRNGGRFHRLPGTRDEAKAIFSLINEGRGLLALDFEASRATLAAADLTQYRVVHFATHGMVNSTHPELSGVVLSLVNERGEPQNGYLRLHDIYNLKLSAELVVLSACQTALGKEVRGEGLVGLTRGFMYAGSQCVVASLWKVHDQATAQLMTLFYEGVRRNQRPAAALREAQVKMSQHELWGKSSYYWAAFVIQGEWK